MNSTPQLVRNERVFARIDPEDFAGRGAEMERLVAEAGKSRSGLAVLAQPHAGCSELLRQVYDRLFRANTSRIPFYFEIRRTDRTAAGVARRFLQEFLAQITAFRRRDIGIALASPSVEEAAELAAPGDGLWVDRSVESYRTLSSGDGRALIAGCIAAPIRAARSGLELAVFIDGFDRLDDFDDGEYLFGRIVETFVSADSVSCVLAGRRRALFSRTGLEEMRLDALTFADAGDAVERTARRLSISISEQTRDLIAVQMGGRIGRIASLLRSASGSELDSFERVETAYTEALLGGPVGRRIEANIRFAAADPELRRSVIELLNETLTAPRSKVPADHWYRRLRLHPAAAPQVLSRLHEAEIINLSGGTVGIESEDIVTADFIGASYRLEIAGEPRGLVVGDSITRNLKRASALMARHYRSAAAIGLSELLTAFDGSPKPAALFDYRKFKDSYKGLAAEDLEAALASDAMRVEVPKLSFVAATSAFYPKFDDICETERSAAGLFQGAGGDPAIFLAVEIASKLEARRDVAEYWCDRLEMAAVNAGYYDSKLWLIATEGFDEDASAALAERGALFSSRRQAELLAAMLGGAQPAGGDSDVLYELSLPMGEDTELIAAHTLEEIARRHDIPAKTINQIKTALVEAFINATEHSLSPDRKIHQTISVSPERIAIMIKNRGVRLADRPAAGASDENRRGWGLQLMRKLMDEVRVEPTDDGTSLTLIKRLHDREKAPGSANAAADAGA
jgi:anti-sigma regulatory factor (Ser/Thr protein kinase)